MRQLTQGMNLIEALKWAEEHHCAVWKKRRTGEVVVLLPDFKTRVTANCRRKDSPRKLIAALRKLEGAAR